MGIAVVAPLKWRTLAIWILRSVLGVIFAVVGATKLTGTGNTIAYFAAIGWGEWFRYFTGIADLASVAFILVPRSTFYGAIMLACSAGLAAAISLTVLHGDPDWGDRVMVGVPLALTLLAGLLAWLTLPRVTR